MIALICKTVIILFYYQADFTNGLAMQGTTDALCEEVLEHDNGYYLKRVRIKVRTKVKQKPGYYEKNWVEARPNWIIK